MIFTWSIIINCKITFQCQKINEEKIDTHDIEFFIFKFPKCLFFTINKFCLSNVMEIVSQIEK